MLRRLLFAALILLAPTVSFAQKTPAQIQTEINSLFANNNTGAITPQSLRTVTTDLSNAFVALTNATTCTASQWFYSYTAAGGGTFICKQPAFSDISGTATNSQLANMNANTIKGNNTGAPATPIDLTATQATAILNAVVGDSGSGGTKGLAPAASAGDAVLGKLLGAGGSFVSGTSIGTFNLVSPMDSPYLAKCDGTTDDSTALQAWLTGISSNGAVGWVPAGKTCIFNGLFAISSNTTIFGYGATFKLKASGNANSGFVCGPTSQLGGPINLLTIYGLTIDGNRANQTATLGTGAMLYCVSATRVFIKDMRVINSRADGFYFGGDSGGQGRSAFLSLVNLESTNSYRNGMSIVGVDRSIIIGGQFNSTTNTTNDGPQCGIDFEPNGATTNNTYITVFGASASSNGGTLSTTGGSGICVFGSSANSTGLLFYGTQATSNQRYGIDTFASSSPTQVRINGTTGGGNGTALVDTSNVVDWFPTGIVKNTASSCGVGFACVGVPN